MTCTHTDNWSTHWPSSTAGTHSCRNTRTCYPASPPWPTGPLRRRRWQLADCGAARRLTPPLSSPPDAAASAAGRAHERRRRRPNELRAPQPPRTPRYAPRHDRREKIIFICTHKHFDTHVYSPQSCRNGKYAPPFHMHCAVVK